MEFKQIYNIKYEGYKLSDKAKNFLEMYHYKNNARSLLSKHVYTIWHEELLIGVAVYGTPCGINCIKKYGEGTLELRRFCLIDEAPKNSESYFLAATLRDLIKFNVKKVLSYADTNQKHKGTIYKASNFKYLGVEKYKQKFLKYKGKMISTRVVYQKRPDGTYFESALVYQSLKNSGHAKFVTMKPKHIYLYEVQK